MIHDATIGTIVHYVSHGTPVRADGSQAYTSQCRAAVITAVDAVDTVDTDETRLAVSLHVFNPDGDFYNHHIPWAWHGISAEPAPGGTWHEQHYIH